MLHPAEGDSDTARWTARLRKPTPTHWSRWHRRCSLRWRSRHPQTHLCLKQSCCRRYQIHLAPRRPRRPCVAHHPHQRKPLLRRCSALALRQRRPRRSPPIPHRHARPRRWPLPWPHRYWRVRYSQPSRSRSHRRLPPVRRHPARGGATRARGGATRARGGATRARGAAVRAVVRHRVKEAQAAALIGHAPTRLVLLGSSPSRPRRPRQSITAM